MVVSLHALADGRLDGKHQQVVPVARLGHTHHAGNARVQDLVVVCLAV